MSTSDIQVGKTYKIISQRKGKFTGTATAVEGEWVTVLITNGKAQAMMSYNERVTGEEVTVRRSLTTFTLVEGGAS